MLILFMTFLFLLFVVLAVTIENMFFLGIALLIIGALFSYIKIRGMTADPKATLFMGVYCIVWGLIIVVASVTHSGYEGWIVAEGFGGVFLVLGIYQGIIKVIVCKEKVTAIYMGSKPYSTGKGVTYYEPLFSYIYQNRRYQNTTGETFGKRKLRKRYQEWNSYTIYLNPRNPNVICTRRRPQGTVILIIGIGIVCVVIPLFAL